MFTLVTSKGTNCKTSLYGIDANQIQKQISLVVKSPHRDPLYSSLSLLTSPFFNIAETKDPVQILPIIC
jgi:hypothetical protein